MCEEYEKDPEKFAILGKHPKNLSLREFVVNFSKKWKYHPVKKAFLHSIPCYRYIVHKGKNIYEDFCKWMLLTDKPGCTLENVGKDPFGSCEEELRDFVKNSEFCPELVKKDFYDSQVVVGPSFFRIWIGQGFL